MSNYHVPVMLHECIEGLNINPDGIYIDVTFGGGGHSKEILKHLNKGKLFAFDRDADALENAKALDSAKFELINSNFRYLKKQLRLRGVKQVDGILADLGVSSHQIDEAKRGFSTRFHGPLDMRMDTNQSVTAADVLNNYQPKDLVHIFSMYGEIKNAKTLAEAIVKARIEPITTTSKLIEIITPVAPKHKEFKYFAQVFQALRIEVNEEMKSLEEFLTQTGEVLAKGGRLVVMSYHSLEDRMVKNYIKAGNISGNLEKDFYGNVIKPLESITRKPVEATEEEINQNNRARSAKLRIAEKQ
jgi:16S rRNA (cytosine1402-N4)-methyltransferase